MNHKKSFRTWLKDEGQGKVRPQTVLNYTSGLKRDATDFANKHGYFDGSLFDQSDAAVVKRFLDNVRKMPEYQAMAVYRRSRLVCALGKYIKYLGDYHAGQLAKPDDSGTEQA